MADPSSAENGYFPDAIRQSLESVLAYLAEPCVDLPADLATDRDLVRSWFDAVTCRKQRFDLGTLCATPGVMREIPPLELQFTLTRHHMGDWGNLDAHDWLENDRALHEGYRLLSAYMSVAGTRYWIITESDRSVTTVLLPEEY